MTLPPSATAVRGGALLLAVLLAGCGGIYVPAPSAGDGSAGEGTATAQVSSAPVQRPVQPPVQPLEPVDVPVVTVNPGDSLYGIARRHAVPVRGVVVLNRLQPPYRLNSGQKLVLPPASRLYTVEQGDTAYSIARRYGVSLADLAEMNALEPPGHVLLGQQLVLPGPELLAHLSGSSTRPATSAVASAVGVEPLPPLAAPPTQTEERPQETAPAPSASKPAASAPAKPKPSATASAARGGASAPFLMPVEGRIASGYGPKSGGLQNDGLNIVAPRGTAVRAAGAGVVVYAGNELPGFGNLVLVKHDDGWVTAYGHTDSVLVKRGDNVSRGQTIATVGSTGNVSEPQLHFELRKGSRAVDPTPYLTKGA